MKITTLDRFKLPEGLRVPLLSGLLYRVTSRLEEQQCRRIVNRPMTLNHDAKREKKIIVSVTSFPARIDTVAYSLACLFNQTMKPDRIILWLAESQFPTKEVPQNLQKLCQYGLEIRFCPEDLRSHKKYFHILQEQKEDELVITFDDDLIYPEDSIESLYLTHLQHPNCIVCRRAKHCMLTEEGFAPYNSWRIYSKEGVGTPSTRLFPSTGAGTLYPYGSLSEVTFQKEVFMSLAPTADDLWMRFMSALQNTKIVKTGKIHKTLSAFNGSQEESLQIENCLQGENDRVLKRLSENYPDAMQHICGGTN